MFSNIWLTCKHSKMKQEEGDLVFHKYEVQSFIENSFGTKKIKDI